MAPCQLLNCLTFLTASCLGVQALNKQALHRDPARTVRVVPPMLSLDPLATNETGVLAQALAAQASPVALLKHGPDPGLDLGNVTQVVSTGPSLVPASLFGAFIGGIFVYFALGAYAANDQLQVGGAFAGALAGACITLLLGSLSAGAGETALLPDPLSQKIMKLAQELLAVESYAARDQNNNNSWLDANISRQARLVLKSIYKEKNMSNARAAEYLSKLQTLLANSTANLLLTAEAAEVNHHLVTSDDIAEAVNGTYAEEEGTDDNRTVYEGDMLPADSVQMELFEKLSRVRANSSGPYVAAGKPWKEGKVSYCFARDVGQKVRDVFQAATKQFANAVSCLQFTDVGWREGSSTSNREHQRCNAEPAIFVMSHPSKGCYSYVGEISYWPSQQLQLQEYGCTTIGIAVHELGHALGHAHEQARPDRDKYVEVHWSNIRKGMEHNFQIAPNGYVKIPYDYLSIMHYPPRAFALNRHRPTLTARNDPRGQQQLGQRSGLSRYDVEQTKDMYKAEIDTCSSLETNGMGCIDQRDQDGDDICSDIKFCDPRRVRKCCACGGGVAVQCYKGKHCPDSPRLHVEDMSYCIQDASHAFTNPSYGCVTNNVCKFEVKWKCSSKCVQTSTPGYMFHKCDKVQETDVCSHKKESKCKFWKA